MSESRPRPTPVEVRGSAAISWAGAAAGAATTAAGISAGAAVRRADQAFASVCSVAALAVVRAAPAEALPRAGRARQAGDHVGEERGALVGLDGPRQLHQAFDRGLQGIVGLGAPFAGGQVQRRLGGAVPGR